MCAVVLEAVCVSGHLLDPGTYLFAFAREKEVKLVRSVLAWSGSSPGSQALANLWGSRDPIALPE